MPYNNLSKQKTNSITSQCFENQTVKRTRTEEVQGFEVRRGFNQRSNQDSTEGLNHDDIII